MSFSFSSGDLAARWSLDFSDIAFVNGIPELAQLEFAVQLKFFAAHGFFLQDHTAIPPDGVSYLGWIESTCKKFTWAGRRAIVSAREAQAGRPYRVRTFQIGECADGCKD